MPKPFSIALLAISWAALVGCGNRESGGLIECRGKVLFRGQPVPKGRIDFMPDVSQGSRGPAGYALIEAGEYSTARNGRGVAAGTQLVRLQGFNGVPLENEGGAMGTPLFPAYQTKVEIVSGKSQYDFEVP
jgi:hypothetical protein